ncbi:glycosyl transferase [Blastocladiella britannica]|nr:glycosyl transferase [Blastocladiella britannica]
MEDSKHVFVTVGTTQFAALVNAVLAPSMLAQLAEHGYTHLTVQAGALACAIKAPPMTPPQLVIDVYDYKPSLGPDLARAQLVISHAGAGCLLEALRAPEEKSHQHGRRVVAVINETLLDNHQAELARVLHADGYLVSSVAGELGDAVEAAHTVPLRPFPAQDTSRFPLALREAVWHGL